ncbi:hypothetical protein [Selenomonas sp.]|uniref:hypothetical protein n=1 Tax=Selenomonas sp. TaxID=2053611 RepID=UPI0025FB1D63|nr:hypothetical protein [Selenomonas sp.]MCI6284267.1 hypothetical protein [Selenomonas sp.]
MGENKGDKKGDKYVRSVVRVVTEGSARHVQEGIVLLENMSPYSYDVEIDVEEAAPSLTYGIGGGENNEHAGK